MEKILGGYKIKIEDLNEKNIDIILELANKHLLQDFSDKFTTGGGATFQLELYYDEFVQIDYYWMTISEGMNGLEKKLNEWLKNKDYYVEELDDDEKEDFLAKEIEKYVKERDDEWLEEQFNDIKEMLDSEDDFENFSGDYYYGDVNLEEILSYLYDVFYGIDTAYGLSLKMNEIVGYYSGNIIAKVDDMHYIFFS